MIQFHNTPYGSSTASATEPTEDLKAFERRLREIMEGLEPKARLWRILLFLSFVFIFLSSYIWLTDPLTYQVPIYSALANHPSFVLSICFFMCLIFMGAHRKVVLPSVIAERCRTVLAEYNMTCDNSGKLILRQRPN